MLQAQMATNILIVSEVFF